MNQPFEDAFLIVIAVQRAFDNHKWGLRNNPAAESNIEQLLASWRATSRSDIHIYHRNPMAIAAGNSVPLAVTIHLASPHESKLADETLAVSFLEELPEKLIGDKAYDSDALDRHLEEEYGSEMIAPNRENQSKTQDGRAVRNYLRRSVVERLFAWLHRFRRLVVRYEFHAENFLDMVRLGCMKIVLRCL